MARIVQIDPNTGACTIAMDNGGVRIVHVNEIDYDYPMVGDFVDVVERAGDVLVTKAAGPTTASTAESWANTPPGAQPRADAYPGAQGPYTQPNYQQNIYVNTPVGRPVNKLGYVLFAILLGDFGAHKFFAGKIGLGVLYLCFCWTGVPAIIGLVEGIIALTKPADQYGNIYLT